MYVKREYKFENSIEIEKLYTYSHHRKGEKRNGRSKPTPESMKKYNYRRVINYIRRLIKLNFMGGWHMTLTYRKNARPEAALAKKNLELFMRRMAYHYKKQGHELKYIIVTEYQNKAIHHHVIINDIPILAELVIKQWRYGQPNFTAIYDNDDVATLAEYLVKETEKTFREDSVHGTRYSCSRNLKKPEYTEKVIKANSFREYPTIPEGYILDVDSLVNGVSEVTGYEYQSYTLKKIQNIKQRR